MIDEPCGVIVKYNPCTIYARKGSPCPYYVHGRRCDKPIGSCLDPEYDLWYKEVLRNGYGSFYPNRIKILEIKHAPLFLYHSNLHSINGEAEITSYKQIENKYHYNFDHFYQYKNPVQLEQLTQDPRLPKLAKIGRWKSVYIDKDTIQTIRKLANLDTKKRIKLDKNLANVIEELKNKSYNFQRPNWKRIINHIKKQLLEEGVSEKAIDQTYKIYSRPKEDEVLRGKPTEDIFYAALYYAYRKSNNPKTLDEIAELGSIDKSMLAANYRFFIESMNLKAPRIKPEELIQNQSEKMPENIFNRAIEIAEILDSKRSTQGRSPASLAAVSVYTACKKLDYKITQKAVGEMFNTSTVTICNLYKEYVTKNTVK